VSISFDDLTTFIGKNDIGKSTILDALEIFFNNDTVKIDNKDCNIHSDSKNVVITCDFTELPTKLILDSGEETSLSAEHLTIADDTLRIKKIFECGKKTPSEDVYVVANHPIDKGLEDLLSLKEKELQKRIKDKNINSPLKGNPQMRAALWNTVQHLNLQVTELPVSKSKEDMKSIWNKIDSYLPTFALFQSDRSSNDTDGEVQNPMKVAVQEAIKDVQQDIETIQNKVREKAMEIANRTQMALQEINKELANQLSPSFTTPVASKWAGLFSVGMDTDEGIALNKRGSGVRRLILVGFFKAEAERKAKLSNKKDIIYAIEEPETAQHPDNQRKLVKAFNELAQADNCQIILTTHSPELAKELPIEGIRFVTRENHIPCIKSGNDNIYKEVVKELGLLADYNQMNGVKLLICVEGPTDVIALKSFSRCLREKDQTVIDLDADPRVSVIPLGGSILKYWVQLDYLKKLHCKEIHIYDNDVSSYQKVVDEVNARKNGSYACLTQKYEIENYLNGKAIHDIYGIDINTDEKNVPKLFGEEFSKTQCFDGKMKDSTSKRYLSRVFEKGMNYDYLIERDSNNEIVGWFDKIKNAIETA
jgi:hypothetical protein